MTLTPTELEALEKDAKSYSEAGYSFWSMRISDTLALAAAAKENAALRRR